MNLDINTPRGQQSLIEEREAHLIIEKKWNVQIAETPKTRISVGDGFIVKDNEIKAFFETKCRYDMDYEELRNRGTWLVTMEKVEKCRKVSKLLQVPFIGFLYLLPKSNPTQKLLMYIKITDENGNYCFKFDTLEEQTQQTVNGGQTVRKNAHFPFDLMKIV